MNRQKGFTLIELLVVVGILAILAIAALIAINPVEAQRRSRDSARLQDMARLTAALETYINDNGTGLFTSTSYSSGTTTVRSVGCQSTANWMGVDMCQYLKSIPLDPQNARQISAVTNTTGARGAAIAHYGMAINTSTGNYKFCTFLEADKNSELLNDSGNTADANVFETGVGLTTLTCPI